MGFLLLGARAPKTNFSPFEGTRGERPEGIKRSQQHARATTEPTSAKQKPVRRSPALQLCLTRSVHSPSCKANTLVAMYAQLQLYLELEHRSINLAHCIFLGSTFLAGILKFFQVQDFFDTLDFHYIPAWTILWTTMDPIVDHFYEWPLTKLNLWMPPDL